MEKLKKDLHDKIGIYVKEYGWSNQGNDFYIYIYIYF